MILKSDLRCGNDPDAARFCNGSGEGRKTDADSHSSLDHRALRHKVSYF